MTAVIPVANLITLGVDEHAILLDGDDQAFVLPGIAVAALGAGADGIASATSGSNDVDIQGILISALADALDLGGRNNHVFVGSTATVSGSTGGLTFSDGGNSIVNLGAVTLKGDGWAVDTGDNSRIVNSGVLDAVSGGGIQATGGGNYVQNEGDVTSRFHGVRVEGGSNRIVNTGDIVSIGDIGAGYGVVFSSESWHQDRLFNSGLISGTDAAVLGGRGAELVTNTGRIDGHLLLGAGNDVVVNRGTIDGDLVLDAGDDRYEGIRGSVNGTVDAGGGDDILIGGADTDRLSGQGGADRLSGQDGADALRGGGGADRLVGGTGDDTLEGGTGRDSLYGGDGADTFVFRAGSERDTIAGFTHASDKIVLNVAGVDGFEDLAIRTNAAGDAVVSWADGAGTASITLVGVAASSVKAADFDF